MGRMVNNNETKGTKDTLRVTVEKNRELGRCFVPPLRRCLCHRGHMQPQCTIDSSDFSDTPIPPISSIPSILLIQPIPPFFRFLASPRGHSCVDRSRFHIIPFIVGGKVRN